MCFDYQSAVLSCTATTLFHDWQYFVVLKWFLSLMSCYSWGCDDDVGDDSLLLVAVYEMRCIQQLTIARNQEQKKPPPPHHNRFTALFPGPPGWAGATRELLDFMVQGDWEINRGRHTNHLAGRHSIRTQQCSPPPSPIFYRPDAFPASQPTVSKHWRQQKTHAEKIKE